MRPMAIAAGVHPVDYPLDRSAGFALHPQADDQPGQHLAGRIFQAEDQVVQRLVLFIEAQPQRLLEGEAFFPAGGAALCFTPTRR